MLLFMIKDVIDIDIDIIDKVVIIIDDVLYIGWMVCVLFDVILLNVRFIKIGLVVLVDWGYCELLIWVDFVGKNIFIFKEEMVSVYLEEMD